MLGRRMLARLVAGRVVRLLGTTPSVLVDADASGREVGVERLESIVLRHGPPPGWEC
jgi:hypothetical protein